MGCNTSQEQAAATQTENGDVINIATSASSTNVVDVPINNEENDKIILMAVDKAVDVDAVTDKNVKKNVIAEEEEEEEDDDDDDDEDKVEVEKEKKEGDGENGVKNNKVNEIKSVDIKMINDEKSHDKQINVNADDSSSHVNGTNVPEKDEEEAATKIQAIYRGHKVRSNLKQSDTVSSTSAITTVTTTNTSTSTATLTPPPTSTSTSTSTTATTTNNTMATSKVVKNASSNQTAKTPEVVPTKEELEAEFREDDKELCDAATRIQATFRGHLARKLATDGNTVNDDKDLQEITKKVAEELDIDLTDPELNKAATRIQASFRGHKARRETDNEPAN